MLLFRNATLFCADKVIPKGSLLIREGQIAELGPGDSVQAPEAARIIDLDGLILAPGYIDIQINGAFGKDFTETPSAIYEVASQLPLYGVTAFLPTIITSPTEKTDQALEIWQQGAPTGSSGAIPLGFHLEGPMINPQKKGAHNPAYIQAPSKRLIESWDVEKGVRLVTLAPELTGAGEVIEKLGAGGVVVSAGHTMASYQEAMHAFQNGIRSGTHLFNAMPALNHRSPGLTGALLQHPATAAGLIADGVHVHPAMVDLAWKCKRPDKLVLISDAMAALGMQPGVYHLGDYDVTVDHTSARLPDGTLAGSILTMDKAVRNLKAFTGCTLEEAAACAATNPAQLLGLQKKGWLASGMDADLIVLNPEGDILGTLVEGQIVYTNTPHLEFEK